MESAITVKGQITIPKEIREHLALEAGISWKFRKSRWHPGGRHLG